MKSGVNLTAALTLALTGLLGTPALAEETESMLDGQKYVGVGISPIRFSFSTGSIRPTGGLVRGGLIVREGLMDGKVDVAVEAQAALELHDDDMRQSPNNKGRLRSVYGVVLKPEYKWRDFLSFYGAAGFSDAEIEITGSGGRTITASGTSYEAGVRLNISPAINVNVGYSKYLDEDDLRAEGTALVVNYLLGVEDTGGGYGY